MTPGFEFVIAQGIAFLVLVVMVMGLMYQTRNDAREHARQAGRIEGLLDSVTKRMDQSEHDRERLWIAHGEASQNLSNSKVELGEVRATVNQINSRLTGLEEHGCAFRKSCTG